jgi:pimeloyl-ACP methyl ester carboxylesterase
VYLVDLPGFGSMRRFASHFVLTSAANWLLQWMEAIHVQQAHLIGHSMGGYICIQLAAHRPQAVRRLVLVSPAGLPTGRSLPGYAVPLLIAIRHMKPGFLPTLFIDGLKAGPRTLLRAARDLLTQDVREDLKLITVPTLLIWGENDTLVPPVFGEILHKEIAHSSLHILKKAGHVGMFDSPHEFNTAVLKFLAGEVEHQ